MKKNIPFVSALAGLILLLSSFSIDINNTKAVNPPETKSPNPEVCCFVNFKDGTTKYYSSLKLVTGVLMTPHLLADETIIIEANNISSYQNNLHFAVSEKMLTTKRKSYVATETLPGFAVRIVNGRLNIYSRKFYNGQFTVDEYFLQSDATAGYIVAYAPDLLKSILKEEPKAVAVLNIKTKGIQKTKMLLETANLFNSSQMLTKN